MILLSLLLTGNMNQSFAAGTERGLSINDLAVSDETGKQIVLYNESHALVIGNSAYIDWPPLPGVLRDVQDVEAGLEAHGFQVVVHTDLNKNEIEEAFNDFISRYGQKPDNRLLFYFAGHGHTVTMSYGEEIGYIVPVDAANPNKDLPAFQSYAMDMQRVEYYAKRIQAKHAIFLFDACFSGSLFSLSRAVPGNISYKTASPVRQFITSGSAEETVPDESIFRAQFLRALEGEADGDQDGYVTGTELGEFLQNSVVNYSKNTQHPQYGKIRNPNLDKGDFVFILPEASKATEESQTFSTPPKVTSNFDDIDAQLQWKDYLSSMEEAFTKLLRYEELEVSSESKVAAWTRFIDTFTEDSPFSDHDEELREIARERLAMLSSRSLPKIDPVQKEFAESDIQISKVIVKDEQGNILEAVNGIYSVKNGEAITISVETDNTKAHAVEATWTTRYGKVLPTKELSNTYTAQRFGVDYVVVYIWDVDTGDELQEPLNISVLAR